MDRRCVYYALPTIDFVAGSTQDLKFHIWRMKSNCQTPGALYCGNGCHCERPAKEDPVSVENCMAEFTVIGYENKFGIPLLNKSMVTGSDKTSLTVHLEAKETANWLEGKYIYQISIADVSGTVQIPYQGDLYIQSNINRVLSGGTIELQNEDTGHIAAMQYLVSGTVINSGDSNELDGSVLNGGGAGDI